MKWPFLHQWTKGRRATTVNGRKYIKTGSNRAKQPVGKTYRNLAIHSPLVGCPVFPWTVVPEQEKTHWDNCLPWLVGLFQGVSTSVLESLTVRILKGQKLDLQLPSPVNETVWVTQHSPSEQSISRKPSSATAPTIGASSTCGYWHTFSLLPFLSLLHLNKLQEKKNNNKIIIFKKS